MSDYHCSCHKKMGNDFYFLPAGSCLRDDKTCDATKAVCTICAGEESPGFHTGCLAEAGHDITPWSCDGKGNLTKVHPGPAEMIEQYHTSRPELMGARDPIRGGVLS